MCDERPIYIPAESGSPPAAAMDPAPGKVAGPAHTQGSIPPVHPQQLFAHFQICPVQKHINNNKCL